MKIVIYALLFFGVQQFCYLQTAGFKVSNIQSELPYQNDPCDMPEEKRLALSQILSQPFSFLSSGNQCYAFESRDGQWVIKFFKHHRMRLHKWYDDLPLPAFLQKYQKKHLLKRKKKLAHHFASYAIASEELQEESGIFYSHLHKTHLLHQKIEIIDKLGISHLIDADNIEFLMQKKATLLIPTLQTLLKNNDMEGIKQCLDSLAQLILSHAKKGIKDKDPRLKKNIGFIGMAAMDIDVGRFEKMHSAVHPEELQRILLGTTRHFRTWIKEEYPILSSTVDQVLVDRGKKCDSR